MTDKLTAWLRTVVPAAWSALVTYLIAVGVPEWVSEPLGAAGPTVVLPLVLGGVYAIMRQVEPVMPPWLTAILMGSNKTPVYPGSVPGAPKAS